MVTRNVKLCAQIRYGMEDTESDTIVIKNWPEKFTDILNQIGVTWEDGKLAEDLNADSSLNEMIANH